MPKSSPRLFRRKPERPKSYRTLSPNDNWPGVMRRLVAAGWTDREMAFGRYADTVGKIEQPGLPGHRWSVKMVRYWRHKLGMKANKPHDEKHLLSIGDRRIMAQRIRTGHWGRFLPADCPCLSDLELKILNMLDTEVRPGRLPRLTRKQLATALGVKMKSHALRLEKTRSLGRLVSLGLIDVDDEQEPHVYSLAENVRRLEYAARPTAVEQEQRRLGIRH